MKLSHAEAQALISARLDGPLDPVAERELNAHLATCDSCRAFNASTMRLVRGLQSLPYLPASPAVTRAVLDHVRAPRSPLSWLSGTLPANALPAASAIAAAVIVVFVGSFAAFRFLDDSNDPSTIPAATTIVNDLAQGGNATSESATSDESTTEPVEARIFATENPEAAAETVEPTEMTGETTATEAEVEAPDDSSVDDPATEIGPQGGTSQRLPATEEAGSEPTEAPAVTEAASEPTVAPTTADQAESAARIRNLLGLGTAEATGEPAPTAEPTPEPTLEPTEEPTAAPTMQPTPAPTIEPTDEPTAAPTVAPTDEPTAEPTEEPTLEATVEPTDEVDGGLQIVGPAGDAITRPTGEPIVEPTEQPTEAPTEEPTAEPTDEPTLEPTDEPFVEPTDQPAQDPTAPPIELREETPESGGMDGDDSGELDDRDPSDPNGPDQEIGPSGESVDDDGNPDATPDESGSDAGTEFDDGDEGEPIIEPADGGFDEGNQGDDGPDGPIGEGQSLAEADIYRDIQDVPSEGQDPRLGLSSGGELIFSPNPGRVSLEQDGVTLGSGDGPSGQVVVACVEDCFDISSASQSDEGGVTDTPIGWLDGQVVYERLNGGEYAVEFRIITLDGNLQPVNDSLIGGGGEEYITSIRPYAVDGALLAPSAGGWVRISTSRVEIFGFSQFGNDIAQIRLYPSAGQIAYVSGGTLILASASSPGLPIVEVSYAGSDYDFSPDDSRIAVVTSTGIDILDTSGNLLATYDANGVTIGSLSWLNDGLVFVDLDSGVLRIVQP